VIGSGAGAVLNIPALVAGTQNEGFLMQVRGSMFSPRDRRRRGAAAVELAILLAPLTLLVLVAIDFARVYFSTMTLLNCARNGALYASDPVGVSKYANVNDATTADGTSLQNPSLTSANVTSTLGNDGTNPYVDVSVSYKFPMATGYLGFTEIDLQPKVRMRVAPIVPN
jgi:Flp pilus assembly protein TadG